MKLVAVVGSGSECGKTTVICRILKGIPGLGAVKLSPRQGESRVEWGPGDPGKDTDLYARSGAARVARIVGPREGTAQTWGEIRAEFGDCRGVVMEGARAVDLPDEKCVIFVDGRKWLEARDEHEEREERNRRLIALSDGIVEIPPHDERTVAGDFVVSSHTRASRQGERPGSKSRLSSVKIALLTFVHEFLGAEEEG